MKYRNWFYCAKGKRKGKLYIQSGTFIVIGDSMGITVYDKIKEKIKKDFEGEFVITSINCLD